MNRRNVFIQLLVAGIAALLFVPFIGQVHLFDWDEINFAESAREMLVTKDYLTVRIFFEPFWEKPPLFIWMQVLSMKVFGVNEFAARFPNALCGMVSLVLLFNIGRKLYNTRFGLLWVLVYAGSLLPFFYFKSGIIDPWFNLFIFLGIYFWVTGRESEVFSKEFLFVVLSAVFIGLAILTKGPVSLLIFGLVATVMFILNGFRLGVNWKSIGVFSVVLLFVGGFWFLLQIMAGNADLIKEFIVYQIRLFNSKDAGHGGFPLYHYIILLFGVFPASIFSIQGHKYMGERDYRKTFHTSMIVLLWIVLLLFSIVKTKIVHYSSLTYFPITYLATYSYHLLIEKKYKYRLWQKIMLGMTGMLIAILIILLPVFEAKKNVLIEKGLISHSFTIGNLQADSEWTVYHSFIGLTIIAGLILSFYVIKKNILWRIGVLYISSLLFIFLAITNITPGAEKISQRASIEFFKQTAEKDVYVHSFFKSYATLFYHNQDIPPDRRVFNRHWLTSGDIDKDVYFVVRIDKKEKVLSSYPEISVLYEKNGYVFCIRRAKKFE